MIINSIMYIVKFLIFYSSRKKKIEKKLPLCLLFYGSTLHFSKLRDFCLLDMYNYRSISFGCK